MSQEHLPSGWEIKIDPRTGRHFFINHHTRSTSWIDPRNMKNNPVMDPGVGRSIHRPEHSMDQPLHTSINDLQSHMLRFNINQKNQQPNNRTMEKQENVPIQTYRDASAYVPYSQEFRSTNTVFQGNQNLQSKTDTKSQSIVRHSNLDQQRPCFEIPNSNFQAWLNTNHPQSSRDILTNNSNRTDVSATSNLNANRCTKNEGKSLSNCFVNGSNEHHQQQQPKDSYSQSILQTTLSQQSQSPSQVIYRSPEVQAGYSHQSTSPEYPPQGTSPGQQHPSFSQPSQGFAPQQYPPQSTGSRSPLPGMMQPPYPSSMQICAGGVAQQQNDGGSQQNDLNSMPMPYASGLSSPNPPVPFSQAVSPGVSPHQQVPYPTSNGYYIPNQPGQLSSQPSSYRQVNQDTAQTVRQPPISSSNTPYFHHGQLSSQPSSYRQVNQDTAQTVRQPPTSSTNTPYLNHGAMPGQDNQQNTSIPGYPRQNEPQMQQPEISARSNSTTQQQYEPNVKGHMNELQHSRESSISQQRGMEYSPSSRNTTPQELQQSPRLNMENQQSGVYASQSPTSAQPQNPQQYIPGNLAGFAQGQAFPGNHLSLNTPSSPGHQPSTPYNQGYIQYQEPSRQPVSNSQILPGFSTGPSRMSEASCPGSASQVTTSTGYSQQPYWAEQRGMTQSSNQASGPSNARQPADQPSGIMSSPAKTIGNAPTYGLMGQGIREMVVPNQRIGIGNVPPNQSLGPDNMPPGGPQGTGNVHPNQNMLPGSMSPYGPMGPGNVPSNQHYGFGNMPPSQPSAPTGPGNMSSNQHSGPGNVPPNQPMGPGNTPLSAPGNIPTYESVAQGNIPTYESVAPGNIPPNQHYGFGNMPPSQPSASTGPGNMQPGQPSGPMGPGSLPTIQNSRPIGPGNMPSNQHSGPGNMPPNQSSGYRNMQSNQPSGPENMPTNQSWGAGNMANQPSESMGPGNIPHNQPSVYGNMPPYVSVGPGNIPSSGPMGPGNMPANQQTGTGSRQQLPSNQMYPMASSASYSPQPNAQALSKVSQQSSNPGLYPSIPSFYGQPQQGSNQPGSYPVSSVYPGYGPPSQPAVYPGEYTQYSYAQGPNQPEAYPPSSIPTSYQQQHPSGSTKTSYEPSQTGYGSNQSHGSNSQTSYGSNQPNISKPPSAAYSTNTCSAGENRIRKARIEAIDRVLCMAVEMEPKVLSFNGRRGDKEFLSLEEQLTRYILELDKIQTEGIEDIRTARKSSIHRVQCLIDALEAKS